MQEIVGFWSSVELTGNQTERKYQETAARFWSSVELTGNQTARFSAPRHKQFWSSVELTGNQTQGDASAEALGFGAVSN